MLGIQPQTFHTSLEALPITRFEKSCIKSFQCVRITSIKKTDEPIFSYRCKKCSRKMIYFFRLYLFNSAQFTRNGREKYAEKNKRKVNRK